MDFKHVRVNLISGLLPRSFYSDVTYTSEVLPTTSDVRGNIYLSKCKQRKRSLKEVCDRSVNLMAIMLVKFITNELFNLPLLSEGDRFVLQTVK